MPTSGDISTCNVDAVAEYWEFPILNAVIIVLNSHAVARDEAQITYSIWRSDSG